MASSTATPTSAPAWERWVDGCPHFAKTEGMECPFKTKDSLLALTQQIPASHIPDPTSLVPTESSISVEAMLLHLSRAADALAEMDATSTDASSDEEEAWPRALAKKGDAARCPLASSETSLGPYMRAALGVRAAEVRGDAVTKSDAERMAALHQELDTVSGGVMAEVAGMPLSKAMKRVTEKVHAAAQNCAIVLDFQRSKLPKQGFVEMTAQLYHLYLHMEAAMDRACRSDERVSGLYDWPRVERVPALVQDLAELLDIFQVGDETLQAAVEREVNERFPANAATLELIARFDKLARMQPLMMLAHAYTRILGDLSGGQILEKKAAQLCPNAIAFYQFDGKPETMKKEFRAALDAVKCTEAERTALLHETCVAFIANIRMFSELDRQRGATSRELPPLQADMKHFAGWTSPLELQQFYAGAVIEQSAEEKCPFLASKKKAAAPKKGECPWPFVMAHDPKAGLLRHWKKNAAVCLAFGAGAALLLRRKD